MSEKSQTLYPSIEPYKTHRIPVSDLHELYVEEVGNPEGQPVVFLHGGPGGGVTPFYRRFFDPQFYRVILFDQRGAGRSTPHAELRENTTQTLMADIETLKNHFGFSSWIVFGGSWGSTLSLCYAIHYPQSVKALALRGIFLCRPQEIEWFYQSGAHRLYPDAWEHFLEPIPESERSHLIAAYYKRLTSDDKATRLQAARAWSVWEASTSTLAQDPHLIEEFGKDEFALAFARIECHYFTNNIFMETNNFILENVHKIADIPCEIVHGRYDVVCPIESAWALKKALPKSRLHIIQEAGHSLSEPGISAKLIEVMEDFKRL